jgi:hypothetical protein
MKVLIPILRVLSTPHYETDLEIAQRHLDRGDSVHLLECTSSIPTCDYVLHHNAASCLKCIERRKDGIQALEPPPPTHGLLKLTTDDKKVLRDLPKAFESQRELREFTVGEFDVGMAVVSTLFSKTRKLNLDVSGERVQLVRDMVHTGVAVYLSMRNHLCELSPDRVYVFNGRFNTVRAVLRACQTEDVEYYTHDRGQDLNHFETYKRTLPHDLRYIEQQIRQSWHGADPDTRHEEAERFYEQRAKGDIPNWHSFTDEQNDDYLPERFNHRKHNVAVYPSSEDEFAAIGEEWENPIYEDQLSALQKVIDDLQGTPDIHLYVRVHPNLKEVENTQTRGLWKLQDRDGVTIIPADSPVSSYALLRASDCVLTFGSTMGIEATYWRKPSVLAGMSLYRRLGGTYRPKTHEEVLALLEESSLSPKPIKPALKYGYYQATKGVPFKYFEPTDVFEGLFRGEKIRVEDKFIKKVEVRLAESGKLDPLFRIISNFTYKNRKENVVPNKQN